MNKLDAFGQAALKHLVHKLFTDGHFSVCTLDKIINLGGFAIDKTIYAQLSAFHCTDFSQMGLDVKVSLQERVTKCLMGDRDFNPMVMLAIITAEGRDYTVIEDTFTDAGLPRIGRIK